MGTIDLRREIPPPGLAGALFSGVQLKVLALLFMHSDRSFYTRQIIGTVGSGSGAVERELARLERSGLVVIEKIGNQKHYRANRDASIFHELHGILRKTVGLHDPLEAALAPFRDRIKAAFVYGSVARGEDTAESDIDLMVISDDLTYADLFASLQQAEKTLARPVNPTMLDTATWRKRLASRHHFVSAITSAPKIFVVGSEKDLMRERQSREPGQHRKT